MRRYRPLLPVVLALVALAVTAVVPASAFAAKGWSYKKVSSGSADVFGVVVSGDRLAWYDYAVDTTPSVYTWDGHGKPLRFTSAFGFQNPDVSGDRLVWTERWVFGGSILAPLSGGAFTWTPATGVQRLSSNLAAAAKVSGDRAIWKVASGGLGHVVPYDLVTWTPGSGVTTLTPPPPSMMGVAEVSGDRVGWSSGYFAKILTWKAGDSAPTTIGQTVMPEQDVLVSGDRVVWCETTDGSNDWTKNQIFTWTPAGGKVQVTNAAGGVIISDYNADVSGDRIVWSSPLGGLTADIFTWTPGGGVATVSSPATYNVEPKVSGDRIVWSGGLADHYQIYTWTPATGTVAVTADRNSNMQPDVSGDRIAWRQKKPGGVFQAVTAVPKK